MQKTAPAESIPKEHTKHESFKCLSATSVRHVYYESLTHPLPASCVSIWFQITLLPPLRENSQAVILLTATSISQLQALFKAKAIFTIALMYFLSIYPCVELSYDFYKVPIFFFQSVSDEIFVSLMHFPP